MCLWQTAKEFAEITSQSWLPSPWFCLVNEWPCSESWGQIKVILCGVVHLCEHLVS